MSNHIAALTLAFLGVVSVYFAKLGPFSRSRGYIVAVGYRHQPLKEGWLVRVGFTALNSRGYLNQAIHLGLGYAF